MCPNLPQWWHVGMNLGAILGFKGWTSEFIEGCTNLFLDKETILEYVLLKHESSLFLFVLLRPIILSIFLNPPEKAQSWELNFFRSLIRYLTLNQRTLSQSFTHSNF